MKRIFTIFLLSLFSFNVIGYYLLYFAAIESNRSEQMDTLFSYRLESLHIPKSELKNVLFRENGKELVYQGHPYDILHVSDIGNELVFLGHFDKKESELNISLAHQTQYNTPVNGNKRNDLVKNPVKDLFYYTSCSLFIPSHSIFKPLFLSAAHQVPDLLLHSPPPESTC